MRFEALLDEFPKLEKQLLEVASNELAQAQDQMLLLGRKSAREKVVSFLLSVSERALQRGDAPSPISLPMSRADIADYLGLTLETVSRTFTNLIRVAVRSACCPVICRTVRPGDVAESVGRQLKDSVALLVLLHRNNCNK